MGITSGQLEVAAKVGKAIAKSTLQDRCDVAWAGLEVEDVDVLESVGLVQGTPEWDIAENVARRTYEAVIRERD